MTNTTETTETTETAAATPAAVVPAEVPTTVTINRAEALSGDYSVTAVDESHACVRVEAWSDPSWCDGGTLHTTLEFPGILREAGSAQLEISGLRRRRGGDCRDYVERLANGGVAIHVSDPADVERLARVLMMAVRRGRALGLIPAAPAPRRRPARA